MPRSYVVGSVPYVNARPLVTFFETNPEAAPVTVRYDVPSRLPALLDDGKADAVLASSIECLRTPRRYIAAGLCIGSTGPVQSVRLFSKVVPSKINTLALDLSSLTSNALAQIVLAERYGVRPTCSPEPPHLTDMLARYDACLLIGDIGMRTDGSGLHVLDLGEEWLKLTGLPFVWALWIGNEGLTSELAGYLLNARQQSHLGAGVYARATQASQDEADEHIRRISQSSSWTFEEVRQYLTETICFDLGDEELAGLREFSRKLQSHGFAATHFPEIVHPDVSAITTTASQ